MSVCKRVYKLIDLLPPPKYDKRYGDKKGKSIMVFNIIRRAFSGLVPDGNKNKDRDRRETKSKDKGKKDDPASKRYPLDDVIDDYLENKLVNVPSLPEAAERRFYRTMLEVVMDGAKEAINSSNICFMSHRITLNISESLVENIRSLKAKKKQKKARRKNAKEYENDAERQRAIVSFLVDRFMDDNIKQGKGSYLLAPYVEKRLYSNLIYMLFALLQDSLSTSHVCMLGHRMSMSFSAITGSPNRTPFSSTDSTESQSASRDQEQPKQQGNVSSAGQIRNSAVNEENEEDNNENEGERCKTKSEEMRIGRSLSEPPHKFDVMLESRNTEKASPFAQQKQEKSVQYNSTRHVNRRSGNTSKERVRVSHSNTLNIENPITDEKRAATHTEFVIDRLVDEAMSRHQVFFVPDYIERHLYKNGMNTLLGVLGSVLDTLHITMLHHSMQFDLVPTVPEKPQEAKHSEVVINALLQGRV